jgi:hypothetical protein
VKRRSRSSNQWKFRTKESKLFIDYDNIPAVQAPEEILEISNEDPNEHGDGYTNESEYSKEESNTAEDKQTMLELFMQLLLLTKNH